MGREGGIWKLGRKAARVQKPHNEELILVGSRRFVTITPLYPNTTQAYNKSHPLIENSKHKKTTGLSNIHDECHPRHMIGR